MKKVLVVEDELNIIKKIDQYIKECFSDLEVIYIKEAGKALNYAKKNEIALFIIDIQLQDYKGTNLAMQLRELQEYKYTPIIFETGMVQEELFAYRDIKCYSFIVKPFEKDEFIIALKEALELSDKITNNIKTIRIEQKQFIFDYTITDIVYIESFGKKMVIHTKTNALGIKEDTISGYTLKRILDLIDDSNFIQCHKSFIVNKFYIEKIDKVNQNIKLKGFKVTIPIGNKYKNILWR